MRRLARTIHAQILPDHVGSNPVLEGDPKYVDAVSVAGVTLVDFFTALGETSSGVTCQEVE
jgi:hypothetical protein